MQDFRCLFAWQRAHALALAVHRTAERFPRGHAGSLKSQLCRAADSIPTNIVEGCGSASQRELARYLDIAIKSASETEYHLLVAFERGVVRYEEHASLTSEVTQIRRMLFALRNKVLIAAHEEHP